MNTWRYGVLRELHELHRMKGKVSKSNNRAIKKKEKRNRLDAARLANQGGAVTNLADFALVIVL